MEEVGKYRRGEFLRPAPHARRARKGESEIVIVARPEILGDDYEELIANLRLCVQAGLLVAFAEKTGRRGGESPREST